MMLESIGFTAGILGIVAWIPQVKTVWFDKKHDGVSLPTFAVVALALTLWMIYGILLPSPAIIFSNVAALLMILSVIIGEGGSETALAFSIADTVMMQKNSIFTPLSPEEAAKIKLGDSRKVKEISNINEAINYALNE